MTQTLHDICLQRCKKAVNYEPTYKVLDTALSYYNKGIIDIEELNEIYELVGEENPTIKRAKEARSESVRESVVEVDDMVFDADETSQNRMMRAIMALDDEETVKWVLHDDTVTEVTKETLGQVLKAAFKKQAEIWDIYTAPEIDAEYLDSMMGEPEPQPQEEEVTEEQESTEE